MHPPHSMGGRARCACACVRRVRASCLALQARTLRTLCVFCSVFCDRICHAPCSLSIIQFQHFVHSFLTLWILFEFHDYALSCVKFLVRVLIVLSFTQFARMHRIHLTRFVRMTHTHTHAQMQSGSNAGIRGRPASVDPQSITIADAQQLNGATSTSTGVTRKIINQSESIIRSANADRCADHATISLCFRFFIAIARTHTHTHTHQTSSTRTSTSIKPYRTMR